MNDDDITALAGVLKAMIRREVRLALDAERLSPPANDVGPLVTLAEAARAAGLTPDALRARAYRGSVPVVRIGRTLRFRLSDLGKPSA